MHTRHRAKALPADQRRAATVDAVIRLAASHNPSEITTAAIATEMSVTQGSLFRHFPSKDAILDSVMRWVCEQLLGRLEDAAHRAPSPLAALELMFRAHVDFVIQHPGIPRILFSELQRAGDTPAKRQARELLGQYQARLRVLIESAREEGVVALETDASAAAGLFIGSIQGLVMRSLLGGDTALMRDQAPGVWALYVRAIRCIP